MQIRVRCRPSDRDISDGYTNHGQQICFANTFFMKPSSSITNRAADLHSAIYTLKQFEDFFLIQLAATIKTLFAYLIYISQSIIIADKYIHNKPDNAWKVYCFIVYRILLILLKLPQTRERPSIVRVVFYRTPFGTATKSALCRTLSANVMYIDLP